MFVLYDRARHAVALEQQMARGGQGAIYTVTGKPGLLAKVYLPKPDEEAEEKLAWMVDHAPPDPNAPAHATFAWPRELLFDAQRHFLGYLMPEARDAWPILRVFNPRSRSQTVPGFGRRYLYRAALNLARALAELHKQDYIVGDLNESNVLVTSRAMITLIDTDSFQVQEPRNHRIIVYPCPVGKPEYTAPELQGEVLWTRPRRWEQDAFALGVMVFQLLMEGNHPFRARWLGSGDPPPLAERIQRGFYPYDTAPSGTVAPPPGVPSLKVLAPEVVELFQRCFVDGHSQPSRRPAADEWAAVLAKTEYAAGPRPRPAAAATDRAGRAASGGTDAAASGAPPPKAAPRRRQRQAPATEPAWVTLGRQEFARLLQNWAQTRIHSGTSRDTFLRLMAGLATAFIGASSPRSGRTPTAPAATAGAQAKPRLVECPRCGRANSLDEIYCQRCSYPLAGERPCPRCGKPMPKNTRYCTNCSSRV